MRVGSFKRVVPLIVSVILVVALLFTITIPLSAASYNLRFIDFGLTYEFKYKDSGGLLGTTTKTLPITGTYKSYGSMDGVDFTMFDFYQDTFTDVSEIRGLRAHFDFDLKQQLVLNVSPSTFYQVSFDMVFPRNLRPGDTSAIDNVASLTNSADDSQVAKLPLTFVRVSDTYGFSRWRGTFILNLTESEIYDTLSLYLSMTKDAVATDNYLQDVLEFFISDLSIVESNAAAFQEYVSVTLDSVLAELGISNGYLEQLVSICNYMSLSNENYLVTMINILDALERSSGSIDTKLDTIISLFDTITSANSSLADKIEAGNQIQQQIADALKNSNQQDAAQNQTDKDKAENFQNTVNDYSDLSQSVTRPMPGVDFSTDFGQIVGDSYNRGFINSTLGLVYDNPAILYMMLMAGSFCILGYILFGKKV